jgi:hypothetical protein
MLVPLLLLCWPLLLLCWLPCHRCYFKLKDIRRLGVCGERLTSARQRLEKAHGAHQERLRQLHGNFSPELTT